MGVTSRANAAARDVDIPREIRRGEAATWIFRGRSADASGTGETDARGGRGRGRGGKRRKRQAALGALIAVRTASGATVGADVLENRPVGDPEALAARLVATTRRRVAAAGGGVDDQTADQLALCLALCSGPSKLRLPTPTCQHLETVVYFGERFLGASYETKVDGDASVLSCVPAADACSPSPTGSAPRSVSASTTAGDAGGAGEGASG